MIALQTPASHDIAVWLAGLLGMADNWLFHAIGMLVVASAVLILVVTPVGLGGVYLERKLAGRMQNRRGPNRVGPYGLLQTLADGVKLLAKEDIIRRGTDEVIFRLAPYVVFFTAFAGFVVLPFGPGLLAADLDVGIFFFLSMIGLETIGIVMAGWSSNNKWSLLGSMREVAQVISYELPLGIAAMCTVLAAGTMSIQGILHPLVRRLDGTPLLGGEALDPGFQDLLHRPKHRLIEVDPLLERRALLLEPNEPVEPVL